METQTDNEKAMEPVIRICIACGNTDTDAYCSKCGSKLEFLSENESSSGRNLINILSEYFREIANPILAYLKTNWLLLRHPIKFFHALYFRDQPLGNLPFLFEPVWRLINRERTQYVLQPITFFASNFVVNLVSTGILLYIFFAGVLGQDVQPSDVQVLSYLGGAGFSTLIYALATAFIFDVLTKESRIPPHFKYSFWVYMFGLVWIGPLVGFFLLILFLCPILIFLCMFSMGLELIQASFFPDSGLYSAVFGDPSRIIPTLNLLLSSVGAIYIFLIMPRMVFSYIFQREGLPTKSLSVIILASLLIPALVLLMLSYPILIRR